jgi:hypothetical protein
VPASADGTTKLGSNSLREAALALDSGEVAFTLLSTVLPRPPGNNHRRARATAAMGD